VPFDIRTTSPDQTNGDQTKKMQADEIKVASRAPHERAADAINEVFIAKYRRRDGSDDCASIYSALGAFAGFGIQMAIRETLVNPGKMPEDEAFVIIETNDGKRYYFGDLLDGGLFGGQTISVWSLIAGAAQAAGAELLPDVNEIASHNAKVLGKKEFGIPRVAEAFQPRETPHDVLRSDWRPMRELLVRYGVEPRYWGWTFAMAAQYLILRDKGKFDPAIAAAIAMEAAISMSKIDPRDVEPDRNPNSA